MTLDKDYLKEVILTSKEYSDAKQLEALKNAYELVKKAKGEETKVSAHRQQVAKLGRSLVSGRIKVD